jgi:hypothetical protein
MQPISPQEAAVERIQEVRSFYPEARAVKVGDLGYYIRGYSGNISIGRGLDEPSAWQSALEFKRKRVQEIEEVKEEVALLSQLGYRLFALPVVERILASRRAALAELTRGTSLETNSPDPKAEAGE